MLWKEEAVRDKYPGLLKEPPESLNQAINEKGVIKYKYVESWRLAVNFINETPIEKDRLQGIYPEDGRYTIVYWDWK